MGLRVKHLAPYLPYGLKMKRISNIEDLTLIGLDTFKQITHNGGKTPIEFVKPILRPMSDLIKEIEHNGVKRHPYLEIRAFMKEAVDFAIEKPMLLEYTKLQKLLELHFDVFGLIDAGLAIDINTVNKKTI